ncbi:hypothetical protein PINS_up024269 [Pythium insidiosum]|nr:hypothetical protein PINS_up024269 [Pythium insidiosum]
MITPTRFGLKFAPTPTLALEYEADVLTLESLSSDSQQQQQQATMAQSLFVYKAKALSSTSRKRLHVVELPQLTRESDAATIARQLQSDDHRFLGPEVVNLTQLRRLLQRLVDPSAATEERDHGGSSASGRARAGGRETEGGERE